MKQKHFLIYAFLTLSLCGCAQQQDARLKNLTTQEQTEATEQNTATEQAEADDSTEYSNQIYAMDTVIGLTAYGANGEAAIKAAEESIYDMDSRFNRTSDGGEIYNVNKNGGGSVSDDTAYIIKTALEIDAATDGAFDITISPVMDLWGFCNQQYHVPTESELKEALERVNSDNVELNGNEVTLKDSAYIDLGGIAKGYASNSLMQLFKDNGVKSALVSLGGNVQALGTKPDGSKWRVGIQDPDNESAFIGVLSLVDKAAITSGGYQRYFEQDGKTYHHIIDPQTGYPADNGVKSVTIICSDGTVADGLSTSLYIMGLDKGIELWKTNKFDFDFVMQTDDRSIYATAGVKDDFVSELEINWIEK